MVTDYDKHLKNVKPEDTQSTTEMSIATKMTILVQMEKHIVVIIPHTKNSKKMEKNNGNFKSIQVCIKISDTVDNLELSLCKQMYCHN